MRVASLPPSRSAVVKSSVDPFEIKMLMKGEIAAGELVPRLTDSSFIRSQNRPPLRYVSENK